MRLSRPRIPASDVVHVVALSAFAVAQPLFDLLGREPSFFAAHRTTGLQLVVWTAVVLLLPPVVLIGVRALVSVFSQAAGRIVHLVTVGALAALIVLGPLGRASGGRIVFPLLLAVALGALVVLAYSRNGFVRRFLSWSALAALVFVGLFLFVAPARFVLRPRSVETVSDGAVAAAGGKHPPIVFLQFDELALSVLIRPDGTINDTRFPNFARLAERTTWYRNATTVATRTVNAVPAILTGKYHKGGDPPTIAAHPDNLFTLLGDTYRVRAREHLTQLCPPDVCGATSGAGGTSLLAEDTALVYLHTVLPKRLADRMLPDIGDRWAGFAGGDDTAHSLPHWLKVEPNGDPDGITETEIVDGFLRDIKRKPGAPNLWFMHIEVPHPRWRYLPNGQTYPLDRPTPGYDATGVQWGPNPYLVQQGLQRSLLQTVLADRMVGRLLDHLDEQGMFDESLIVVNSDHGATWKPNTKRRDILGDGGAATGWIPLFIKTPGQSSGRIDDTNVETIDILPTIADAAGMPIPWRVDGSSLLRDERRPKKNSFYKKDTYELDAGLEGVKHLAAQYEELFGPGGDPDDLYGFGPHWRLIGHRVQNFDVVDPTKNVMVDVDAALDYKDVDPNGESLPAFFRATLRGSVRSNTRIVVALNEVIAGIGQTYRDDDGAHVAVMLSPRLFRPGPNDVAVYLVGHGERLSRLRWSQS